MYSYIRRKATLKGAGGPYKGGMKQRARKKEIGKRRASKEEERNALGEQEEERTCCHQKKESCCCYECSSYKEAQHKKFFDHFYYNDNFYTMLSASEYVIQPVSPHSDISSSVSSVIPPLVSLPSTYNAEP